eukprot:CAMPEP_0117658384 /NCGR_PEP_ID=MMETSP0804-20121206/5836_1 /TAXON_ID=1074897 /ORGANISM="Tetraselmis astigmatica, Strain CCMP880" /LENGTH=73 /DNA_ID=CAMNT_0005464903 /DNA_START=614 /DNA_END=832 /DNA_ORIENTATION=+
MLGTSTVHSTGAPSPPLGCPAAAPACLETSPGPADNSNAFSMAAGDCLEGARPAPCSASRDGGSARSDRGGSV